MRHRRPTFSHLRFLQGFFYLVVICVPILVIDGFLMRKAYPERSLITLIWWPLFIFLIGSGLLILDSIKVYRKVRFFIEQGYVIKGKIIEKYLHWGKGYIVYEYKHHGDVYRASDKFSWTQSKRFKIGQEITAFVYNQSPQQSLLYDLYQ